MLTDNVPRFCRNSALHQRISNDDHQVIITAITHTVKHLDIVQVIITATIHTVQHMDIVLQVQAGAPVMALLPFGAPLDERVGIFANVKGLVLDCLGHIHVVIVRVAPFKLSVGKCPHLSFWPSIMCSSCPLISWTSASPFQNSNTVYSAAMNLTN